MTETVQPGNIARNMASILESQKNLADEGVKPEDVKQTLSAPALYDGPIKSPVTKTEKEKRVFKGVQYSTDVAAKIESYIPIANVKTRLRSMTLKEELNIAQTIINKSDVGFELIQLSYNHLIEGPTRLTESLESFLKNSHEKDIDAYLYGIYLNSYGPVIKVEDKLTCSDCGYEHPVETINLLDLYKEEPYMGEPFSSIEFSEEVDLANFGAAGIKIIVGFPTLEKYDPSKNITKANFLHDVAHETFTPYIKEVIDGTESYTDPESIVNAVESLNPPSRKMIKSIINERFLKYGIKFLYEWTCENQVKDPDAVSDTAKKKCGCKNEKKYRIHDLFFREVLESIS